MMLLATLMAFGLLAVVAPTHAGTCKSGCSATSAGQSNRLKYAAGTVYKYDLNSVVSVQLTGADAQDTKLQVNGIAEVAADGNCNFVLRLPKLSVIGPDGKRNTELSELQLAKPIRFILAGDRVDAEICTEADESTFGLNIKRSIVSLLQTGADGLDTEIDVFGRCPTTTSASTVGEGVHVSRVRDLNACANRESFSTGLVTSVADQSAGLTTTPLINGDYVAEQTIKAGIVERAQLNEDYLFVPYSAGEAGVRAKVVTKLTLKSKAAGKIDAAKATHPKSVTFENPSAAAMKKLPDASLKTALVAAIDQLAGAVGSKAAGKFTELVHVIRFARREDLLVFYKGASTGTVHPNKELARSVFLDALFRAATSESVEAVSDLIKELSEKERRLAYLSFNLVEHVEKEALPAINKLLDGNPPHEAFLSVGNLVSKYARAHPSEAESPAVKNIIKKFTTKLGADCKVDAKRENTIVAVLKGLRNTQHLVNPEGTIACTGAHQTTRVRVAAIQTLAAAACNLKAQQTVLTLLKDTELDSEIRIEAYLTLVACPTAQVANEVKTILDAEKSYQVGSFITTHLAALRSSTDSYREIARRHFANVRTTKKFPSDVRQYSFNNEYSYSLGSLGVGAAADSQVIYSQQGFLPRSGRLNVTAELFGENFNVIELAGRQENLEHLLEHNFGPKGLFKRHTPQELYDLFAHLRDTKAKPNRRGRRSVRQEVDAFKQEPRKGQNDIELDVSLKLFGSEMYFLSLSDQLPLDPKDFVRRLQTHVGQLLQHAKDFKHVGECRSLFLDAELVYPTGVGFPLRLAAHGSGGARLEVAGKIDAEAIVKNPRSTAFVFKTVPSYNVEISGSLQVDGFAVSTGFEVSAGVHSSTGAEIDFKLLDGGKGFDTKFRLPLQQQTILTFDHQIVIITQERGQSSFTTPLKFSSKDQKFGGCFDQLNRLVGITLCSDVSITLPGTPNTALFPLNGPNHGSVSIDVATEYTLNARYDQNGNDRQVTVEFDTPGSSDSRKIIVKLESGLTPKIYARLSLDHVAFKADAEAGLINDGKELVVYALHNSPDKKYMVKFGFSKEGSGNHIVYTPIAIIQTPTKDNVNGWEVTGTVTADQTSDTHRTYKFNEVRLLGPAAIDEPYVINGQIDLEPNKFGTDLTLSHGDNKKVNVKGSLIPGKKVFHLDAALTNNVLDYANGKVVVDVDRDEGHFKSGVSAIYGKDLATTTNRLDIAHDYKFTAPTAGDKSDVSFKGASSIKAPFVPAELAIAGDYSNKKAGYDVSASFQKHRIASKLSAKLNTKSPGDYDVEASASLNKHTAKLEVSREIKGTRSKFENEIELSGGPKAELDFEYDHNATPQNADVKVDASVQMSEKDDPIELNFLLKVTPKNIDTTAKLTSKPTGDLISYDLKVTRGDGVKDGKYTATVKDLLTADGSFKSNAGKGDGTSKIELPTIQRTLKMDTVFNLAATTFDVRQEFYYDFARDPTKKLTVDSKNQITHKSVNSHTDIEAAGEKYQVDVNANAGDDPQSPIGKRSAGVKITLPTDRQISGELNQDVSMKADVLTGSQTLKLVDRLPNKKERSLTYTGKVNDADLKARFFTATQQLEFVSLDGKNAVINGEYKHLPNGHFKTGSASITAKGSLLPEPIDVLISLDEYCPVHAVYRASAKYGSQVQANVNGNYQVGDKTKPYSYEFQASAAIPNTEIKTLKLQSSAKASRPQTEDGHYETEFKVSAMLNDKTLTLDTSGKANAHHGSTSVKLTVPDADPISVDASFARDETSVEDQHSAQAAVEVHYGKGRTVKASGDIKLIAHSGVNVHANLQTPFEHAKNVDVSYKLVKSNENTFDVTAKASADDKAYQVTSQLVLADAHPSVEVNLVYPGKEPAKIAAAFNRLGDRKFNGRVQLVNFGELNLDGKAEVSASSVDTFYATLDVDAPRVKINKVHAEVRTKPNSNGKGIDFSATSDGKNIISGSADYVVKQNGGTDIEGHGNVKIYDQQKSATFVLRQINEKADGLSLVFNANVGGVEKVNANLVMKTKDFQVAVSICEENNKCYKFEVKSLLKPGAIEAATFEHELFVLVDLLELGFDKEFQLKSETFRKPKNFKHDLEMRLKSKGNVQYVYKVLVDNGKATVELVLPKRTLAVDAVYRIPSKDAFGHYEASISTYLDKANHPEQKSTLSFAGDVNHKGSKVSSKGELKFAHPSVKELRIVGSSEFNADAGVKAAAKLELDIFKQPDQAIIVNANFGRVDLGVTKAFNATYAVGVTSKGLGLAYGLEGHAGANLDRRQVSAGVSVTGGLPDNTASIFVYGSDEKIEMTVSAIGQDLVVVDGSFDKSNAAIKGSVLLIGGKPYVTEIQVQGWKSIKAHVGRVNMFNVDAEVTTGKFAKLVASTGAKTELAFVQVALDQAHFLSTEHRVNEDELKSFVKNTEAQWRKDVDAAKKELESRIEKRREAIKATGQKIRDAVPDFSGVREEYKKQVDQLVEELLADKTFKQIYEFVKDIYGTVAKTVAEVVHTVSEHVTKVYGHLTEFYEKLATAVREKLLPALKTALQNIENIVHAVYTETLNLVLALTERAIKALKQFEPDFTKIGQKVAGVIKKYVDIIDRYTEWLRNEIVDLYHLAVDAVKDLPGLEIVRDKLKEIFGKIVPENIAQVLRELFNTVKELLPGDEAKEFALKLDNYVVNKLTNQKVNDLDELKALYVSFVKAVQSLYNAVRGQYGSIDTSGLPSASGYSAFNPFAPFSLEALRRLPSFTSFKFSPWNHLRNEKHQSVADALYTYRPHAFNLLNILPPFEKHAQLVDGRHIFTFSGSHHTFPGTCSYVLAQDIVNHNFSIVAKFSATGKLDAITLLDKANTVELTAGAGIVKLNDKKADLPLAQADIHAWRDFHTVTLLTTYGASVQCSIDLRVCSVIVNGFYHGKLRGILGTADAEPSHDLTLPTGKLTDCSAKLGNAYALTSGCAPVAPVDHEAHTSSSASQCVDFFADSDSNLVLAFPFIRPTKYREACEHAVADAATPEEKDDAACSVARGYVVAARDQHIPIDLPDECTKCGEHSVGDEYKVTVPQNKADVVVVVDTATPNLAELVQPILTQLRADLKARDITDTKITVIGYSKDRLYPSLYSSGSTGSIEFTTDTKISDVGPTYPKPVHTGHEAIDERIQRAHARAQHVRTDFHMSSDARAFRLAMKYPFRSGATKAILAVRSDSLTNSANPIKQIGAVVHNELVQLSGISIHLVGPVEDVKAPADFKGTPIGFSEKTILSLDSAKKNRQVVGSTVEQRDGLQFTNDLGIATTEAAGGYVFNSNAFNDAKAPERKKFVGVVAAALAEHLARTEVSSNCECDLDGGLYASEDCEAIETKWRPPVKRISARG